MAKEDMPKCAAGQLPVVRLALKKEKCARAFESQRVQSVENVIDYVNKEYGCKPQEYMLALGLDNGMVPVGLMEVSVGGVGAALVDPRVLFSGLLLMRASAFILFHNHPSTFVEPSQEDMQMTRTMKQAGQLLSLRLLDHIIVGGGQHLSFMARGLL